jgi:hypothetical protein
MSLFAITMIGLWLIGTSVVWVLALLGIDPDVRLYYSNAMQLAVSLASALVCLVVAFGFPSKSALRRLWTLTGLSCFFWFIGQILFASYPLLNNGKETPFPSIADIGYLAAPLTLAAALWVYKRGMGLQAASWGMPAALAGFAASFAFGLYSNWGGITSGETATVLVQSGYALFQPIMMGMLIWVVSCFAEGRCRALTGSCCWEWCSTMWRICSTRACRTPELMPPVIGLMWVGCWALA